MQFFQSPEDYYARFDIATSIRLLRIFMFLISLIAPAMVIVVSITAIASFATPAFEMAISARSIRFLFMLGAASLFKVESPSRLSYPFGITILFISIMSASNVQEHLEEGLKIVMKILHIPLFVVIPLLLLFVAFLRNRKKTSSKKV